jgi:alkylation response protein AidB-like acyl-CoA dehydrogenase
MAPTIPVSRSWTSPRKQEGGSKQTAHHEQATRPRLYGARARATSTFRCSPTCRSGSDLAGLSCRAERYGDEWVVSGQKVWSSGAQFSQWGQLIARTDPEVVKHKGLTAFMLPLDAPGVEVRPIKQMNGGSSFCEVFFSDVRISDDLRLGDAGDGWKVATTTLSLLTPANGEPTSGTSTSSEHPATE